MFQKGRQYWPQRSPGMNRLKIHITVTRQLTKIHMILAKRLFGKLFKTTSIWGGWS